MSLSGFSTEILLIAEYLENSWDLSAFSRTNRLLYSLLSDRIYQHNIRYFHGSMLEWAAAHGSELVAHKAMEAGADQMNYHRAIILAAYYGHVTILQLFLERGKIPTYLFTEWQIIMPSENPLIWAAKAGHESVVKLFLENGACAYSGLNEMEGSALISAAHEGHFSVVKMLGDAIPENPPIMQPSFLWFELGDASII